MPRRSKLEAAEPPRTDITEEEFWSELNAKYRRYRTYMDTLAVSRPADRQKWDEDWTGPFRQFVVMMEGAKDYDKVKASEALTKYVVARFRAQNNAAANATGGEVTIKFEH